MKHESRLHERELVIREKEVELQNAPFKLEKEERETWLRNGTACSEKPSFSFNFIARFMLTLNIYLSIYL